MPQLFDRAKFFAAVREDPFGGHIIQSQVDGLNAIVEGWEEKYSAQDVRWLAYCLATTFHETGRTMHPIEEWGRGHGHPYGVPDPSTGKTYYGRGYVQLTWKNNYAALAPLVGADLVGHPELALEPANAAIVMFEGMIRGLFTTKKLGDYFNDDDDDALHARRIINAMDRADDIAGYHDSFLSALQGAVPAA
jgi:putative chitinase